MYLRHFGLRDKPFRVVPSPRFLFSSDTHDEGRARILYGIRESRGFVVVTGEIGLGKTTVMLSVLDQLEAGYRVALLFNPVDDFSQLLRALAFEFGIDAEGKDEVTLLRDLNLFLIECLAAGETCVLLVDEAQNLSLGVLERLRTLSNLQTEESSLLQIVLVGQPELLAKLEDPALLQLRQRVGVWYEVEALNPRETFAYIGHRLKLAGARIPEQIIDRITSQRVHDYSSGIPRVINQLCDTAMVIAFGRDADRVRIEHVDEAAVELRLKHRNEATSPVEGPSPETVVAGSQTGSRRIVPALVVLLVLAGLLGFWRLGGVGLVSGDMENRDASASGTETVGLTVARAPSDFADAEPTLGTGSREKTEAPKSSSRRERGLLAEGQHLREKEVSQIEAWRREGQPVYTVHLTSVRSEAEARRWVEEILQRFPDWPQPLFVEVPGEGRKWYRVFSGGFLNRVSAGRWIEQLKTVRGLSFAQLSRLDPRAREISASWEVVGEQTGVMP